MNIDWRMYADRTMLETVPEGAGPTAADRVALAARIVEAVRKRLDVARPDLPADLLDLDYDLLCAARALGPILPAEARS